MSGKNDPTEHEKKTTKEEDDILARRARAGDQNAREALILNHLPLVNRMLSKYAGKGIPSDVLYQEACYGLILAVDKYDPDNGTTLGTYAAFYIEKYLHLAMMENGPHPIMLKYKARKNAKGYQKAQEALKEESGRQPSIREIADYLGISYRETASLMNGVAQTVVYDDYSIIVNNSECAYSPDAETEALKNLNEMCLDAFPVKLTKRERDVLYLRFGFGPKGKPHTFLEIGQTLGICDETAAKICRSALQKLRESVSKE